MPGGPSESSKVGRSAWGFHGARARCSGIGRGRIGPGYRCRRSTSPRTRRTTRSRPSSPARPRTTCRSAARRNPHDPRREEERTRREEGETALCRAQLWLVQPLLPAARRRRRDAPRGVVQGRRAHDQHTEDRGAQAEDDRGEGGLRSSNSSRIAPEHAAESSEFMLDFAECSGSPRDASARLRARIR